MTLASLRETRKAIAGSFTMQFPCVIHARTGDMEVHEAYRAALETGASTVPYLTTLRVAELPALQTCLHDANIVARRSSTRDTSSHGSVTCVTLPGNVRGVVKVMSLCLTNTSKAPGASSRAISAATHNSSLVDPYLTCLGSKLAETKRSVGFARLYATFLARAAELHGETDVPVVAVVMERLDDILDKRIAACMPRDGGTADWRRLIGLVLQVMATLAQGQAAFGLVHNDTHLANFMVSDARDDHHHHPRRASLKLAIKGGAVLALPLLERVVLIDFGRASFATSRGRVVTSEIDSMFPSWEKNGLQSDVMHFAAMLLLIQPRPRYLEEQAALTPQGSAARALLRLIKAALQCAGGTLDMHEQYATCHASLTQQCAHDAIHTLRKTESLCRGALPLDWLRDAELVQNFIAPG